LAADNCPGIDAMPWMNGRHVDTITDAPIGTHDREEPIR